jgi:hypothetical protein
MCNQSCCGEDFVRLTGSENAVFLESLHYILHTFGALARMWESDIGHMFSKYILVA